MIRRKYAQMSESYFLGALLTIVGGFLDAHTYISRGNVFANAQTGNIILWGLSLAERNWTKAFHYMIPILAFVLGVFISEKIKSKFKHNTNIHWRQIVVGIEIIVIAIVSFIPPGNMDIIANSAISFVCSLQYDSFRRFTTTFCTGNLRIATEQLFIYTHTKNTNARTKSFQTYGIIFFFIVGVVLGAFLTKVFIEKALLFNCALLIVIFCMMFIKEDNLKR
jgi:uncharacterized membrane protein YoaK (UPF0700 family)